MAALKAKKREISQKVWIADLIKGNFSPAEGWNPGFVIIGEKKVSRANILATVAGKFTSDDGNYAAITLDDGTETIRSKAFGPDAVKFHKLRVGSIVRFVGKIKEYNGERYLKPEIAHEISDPNWLIAHKLEMGVPEGGMPAPEEVKPTVSEEVAVQQIKVEDMGQQAKILKLIRDLDSGEGAPLETVMEKSGFEAEEAQNIIIGLLKAGEVYEPRKGKLKVLD